MSKTQSLTSKELTSQRKRPVSAHCQTQPTLLCFLSCNEGDDEVVTKCCGSPEKDLSGASQKVSLEKRGLPGGKGAFVSLEPNTEVTARQRQGG